MDGYINAGQMDKWMDGCLDSFWMDKWMHDGQIMNARIWMDESEDEWMHGWMGYVIGGSSWRP